MIFQPTYFPTIESFKLFKEAGNNLIFETQDFFEKQTYRTRCQIYAANGSMPLIIPIKHRKKHRQYTKDVKIEYDFGWQKNHLKSLQNSYRSSPFFEFYEDYIVALYEKKEKYLLDFLFQTIDLSFQLLQWQVAYKKTSEYIKSPMDIEDKRYLADFKNSNTPELSRYVQVFESKHGYIPNLSFLDLLFHVGPQSTIFLSK